MIPINFGNSPFGVRLDGAYSEINPKSEAIAFANGDTRTLDGTFDFVFGPHLGSFQPYLLGGFGIYDLRFRGEDVEGNHVFESATTRFGWNAGGGFAFRVGNSNTHVFVEARYTRISLGSEPFHGNFETEGAHFTLVPVNVGLIF